MIWQGKAVGALIGVFTAGPVGALVGAFVGHLVDAQAEPDAKAKAQTGDTLGAVGIQELFFRATFQVMGHLAKADGRVSEEDIRAARSMMNELRLGEREVRVAIDLFTQGKDSQYPLDATLQQLRTACRNRPDLCRMFVQIQLQAALWASGVDSAARRILKRICAALDVSAYELVQMEALLRMQRSARAEEVQTPMNRLTAAYEVLGITAQASDAEVTKAYRRLMNQNHPDKLVAKGLPESMMKVAEEKTRQVRAAYEAVREARGTR